MPGFIFVFPTVQSPTWFEGNSRFMAFTFLYFLYFLLWQFLLSLLCQASLFCFPWCKVQLGLREIRVQRLLHFPKTKKKNRNNELYNIFYNSSTFLRSRSHQASQLIFFCSNIVASTIWMQETELNQGNPSDVHNITGRTYSNLGCLLFIHITNGHSISSR